MKFIVSVLQSAGETKSNVRRIGEFESLDGAIAAAKRVVNDVLSRAYTTGMSSSQLLARYRESAEAPYIFRDDDGTIDASSFNHVLYARTRSEQMCSGAQ